MHIFSPQKPWVECKIGGRFDTFIWMVSGEFSYQRTNMLPAWCGPAAIITLKSRRTWPVLQHVDAGWTTHFLRDGTTKNFYFRRFPRKSYSTFNFQDLLHIYIYIYIYTLSGWRMHKSNVHDQKFTSSCCGGISEISKLLEIPVRIPSRPQIEVEPFFFGMLEAKSKLGKSKIWIQQIRPFQ